MARVNGLEPLNPTWKDGMIPFHHTRAVLKSYIVLNCKSTVTSKYYCLQLKYNNLLKIKIF